MYKIRFVFLVYNGPAMHRDPRVLQWPLGVATYRGFPTLLQLQNLKQSEAIAMAANGRGARGPLWDQDHAEKQDLGLEERKQRRGHHDQAPPLPLPPQRAWLCNFYGTIYEHSSRGTLLAALKTAGIAQHCMINPRHAWMPKETAGE